MCFVHSMGIIAKILKKIQQTTLAIENPGYYVAKELLGNIIVLTQKSL